MVSLGYQDEIPEDEIHILKQIFFSLALKRQDDSFGDKEERGKASRNAFLNKGTKKEAIKFFEKPSVQFLFWGDFAESILALTDEIAKSDKERAGKISRMVKAIEKKIA